MYSLHRSPQPSTLKDGPRGSLWLILAWMLRSLAGWSLRICHFLLGFLSVFSPTHVPLTLLQKGSEATTISVSLCTCSTLQPQGETEATMWALKCTRYMWAPQSCRVTGSETVRKREEEREARAGRTAPGTLEGRRLAQETGGSLRSAWAGLLWFLLNVPTPHHIHVHAPQRAACLRHQDRCPRTGVRVGAGRSSFPARHWADAV